MLTCVSLKIQSTDSFCNLKAKGNDESKMRSSTTQNACECVPSAKRGITIVGWGTMSVNKAMVH